MKNIAFTKKEEKEILLWNANKEISRLEAMKVLIKADDDCTVQLHIDSSISHFFSSSGIFLKVIDGEIKEIKKAIAGKKNKWE